MSNRRIQKRTYYQIRIALDSPISIGNGISADTDADVIRSSNGDCFIPGTSLAGAFRNYICADKKTKSIFGYSDGSEGSMSSVYISDLYFEPESVCLSIRDRVSLEEDKGVDNKFDLEIIETGASGLLSIETVQREGEADPDEEIDEMILAAHEGDIRFGAIKNRGFGRIKVLSVRRSVFTADNREEWIRYLAGDPVTGDEELAFEEWSRNKSRKKERFDMFQVPLHLTGGISIRRYSAQPGKADFEHITSNGRPVIPGTSWNGAIRADARQILIELGLSSADAQMLIENWFGKVKEGKKGAESSSCQSRIVFAESVITGAKVLPMTRNNINRFTGGTKEGALYTELSYADGDTVLEYMIEKKESLRPLRGLMKLVVRDICEGMLAIGGQVSVGRGIFRGDTGKWDPEDEDLKALFAEIRRIKDGNR